MNEEIIIKINGKEIITTIIDDVQRLPCNPVIKLLMDTHPYIDYNMLGHMPSMGDCSEDDRRFIYQNVGYSVCGYAEIFPEDEIENKIWDTE